MGKIKKREEHLQTAVSTYVKLAYPNVVFTAESSGIRVPIGIAVKMKQQRSKHKLPDMIILEPNAYYNGLIIELKREGTRLKNGNMPKTEHITEQQKTLDLLLKKNYYAVFCCGFDEAKKVIDNYMAKL